MLYKDIVLRDKFLQFIKIGGAEAYTILGAGSEDLALDLEAEEFEFKPVTSKSGMSAVTGYNMSTSVEQVVFKDDLVFQEVFKLFRKQAIGSQAQGKIINAYLHDVTGEAPKTAIPADEFGVGIVFTSYGGASSDPISISYELKYSGQPVAGTATIDYEAKTATFTPTLIP